HAYWEMFKDYPVFGKGYFDNGNSIRPYVDKLYPNPPFPFYANSHSTPLEILASTGIVGFSAYLWFWISVLLYAFRKFRRLPQGFDRALCLGILVALLGFH